MHWIYLISVKIISSEICFRISIRDVRVTPEWVRLWHCGSLFFLLALIVFCARQPRKHWEQTSLAFRDKAWHPTSLKTKKSNRGFTSATAAGSCSSAHSCPFSVCLDYQGSSLSSRLKAMLTSPALFSVLPYRNLRHLLSRHWVVSRTKPTFRVILNHTEIWFCT